MSPICCKSWRVTAHFHYFCTLARGHAERCSCDGRIMPADAIPYEADTELHAFLDKQRADQAKIDAKKADKNSLSE